ncbi:choline ethanolaminephosphotransferase [Boletus edulis BED1]|uniref:diacylglycerol cholinephosphotransferase n=1 Tax=Boletus edulis BED1 TaxID=1328754 RepID=A0AAD4BNK2_BOLED|nr:choline ethanolaminephosphotransferase [Boletus edulis BED1]
MPYLSQTALKNLKLYAYKAVDESLVSRYVLAPYWNWFITLWPRTVAPNTITLLGLAIVVLNLITLLIYDPLYYTNKDGPYGPPQWIYFTWALGLFMYQSFDAVDGKQARRTGMAGPLGQLFDHGCDALNTTLEVVLACRALNLGRSWWTVASQIATLANFYLTTWEEHHTGILYLGPFSGPVEGILMIVFIYVISGIFGPSFWDQRFLTFTHLRNIPQVVDIVPDIGLNEAFMVFAASGLAFNIVSSYGNVYKAMRATGRSTLKPLVLLLPFVVSTVLQVLWLLHPSFYHSNIIHSPLFLPVMCAWGLQFAHHVGRMILSHVTKTPFPWWDPMWIWSAIGVLDAHLPNLLHRSPIIQSTPRRTAIFVYLTLIISFIAHARFCTFVIRDITEYLGMACFTVRKKDAEGVWRDTRDMQQNGSSKHL